MYVLIVIGNGIDCYSQLLLFVWHSLCCRYPFLHSSQFSCMFLRFSFWGRSNGSPVGICSLPCFISSLHPFILSNSKTSSWVILYASSSVLSQGTSSLLMLKLFLISFIHSSILSLVCLLLASSYNRVLYGLSWSIWWLFGYCCVLLPFSPSDYSLYYSFPSMSSTI